MRCIVCDSTDRWVNVDEYRHAKKGMHLCESCGFVSYPHKYKTEDEIKKFYEADYRQPPNVNNLFTGHKKLHIHSAFLTELLKSWQENKLEAPVVADIGAAYGMFLNWVKSYFPKADLNGTEYARAYRRNAFWEFGINLGLDFDKSKKYHLISSFKVAEHQLDADKRIREYAEALHEDGFLYISVPIWHTRMSNFGADGWDLEYYYDSNHINVWSQRHFETILAKAGLEIVKVDHWMYDSTYLCKRNDEMMKKPREYEKPESVRKVMEAVKKASLAFGANKFEEALSHFANFPLAWINYYETERAKVHAQNQGMQPLEYIKEHFLEPALKHCPYSLEVLRLCADVHMRYSQYEEAAKWIQTALDHRPNNAAFIMALSHCFREIGLRSKSTEDRIKWFNESRDCVRYLREIDLSMRNDAVNWIYRDNSELPTPHEGVK